MVPVIPGGVDVVVRSHAIEEALARYRPGRSLEQFFYTSEELFEYERRTWLACQWFLIGHSSEVPRTGSYIVRELLGESLIVVRTATDAVKGFFNVCRHRGSRICRDDGIATAFTCPYHAWSYAIGGRLRSATALVEGTDKAELGLKPVRMRQVGGLLFCSLDPKTPELDATPFLPGLEYQGVPGARIAARRHYPTAANWKLVMENFHECYHCLPAHPQYSGVMGHVKRYSMDAAGPAAEWNSEVDTWARTEALSDFPQAIVETADADWSYTEITRFPIGGGRRTQSEDGQPVAPLMGRYPRYDGGVGTFGVPPFSYFFLLNDHAVLFQFLPRATESTDVTATWLVDAASAPDAVDVERLVWLWDVTTLQDKAIIEANAAGVRSRAYEPGPFSKLELWGVPLITQYIEDLRAQ
jgi:Rieske 2Fe-2S family protein